MTEDDRSHNHAGDDPYTTLGIPPDATDEVITKAYRRLARHRDDVINGKFAAGLAVVAITLVFQAVLVTGLGIFRLGVTPDGEDTLRLILFVLVSIVAVGAWLAFAILCSVVFRRAATSAVVAIAAWLVFALFIGALAELAADRVASVGDQPTQEQVLRNANLQLTIERFSPKTLYVESASAVLSPLVTSLDVLTPQDVEGLLPDTALSLRDSLLLVWPQLTALVALIIVLFGLPYIVFMRQEVRA
jgi:ABC-2 type transport system permease protein